MTDRHTPAVPLHRDEIVAPPIQLRAMTGHSSYSTEGAHPAANDRGDYLYRAPARQGHLKPSAFEHFDRSSGHVEYGIK